MDGKYAKYIQNFMKNFKVNGEKVEIQTDSNTKNKPLTYDLTGEVIEKCNDKLDTQYQIITDNEEEIQNNLTPIANKLAAVIWGSLGIATVAFLMIPTFEVTLAIIIKAIPLLTAGLAGLGMLIIRTKKINFMNFVHIVKDYKKNRKAIEESMRTDENITKYLSNDTKKMLSDKTKLMESGKSSEILDMDFMDKLLDKKSKGRRELINLLNMYKAVISLNNEPTYVSPKKDSNKKTSKKNTPKKKTRKKEDK
ncbi:MAG: hypothetical protein IJE89_05725 [Bacilli bacterium]|nr:hypothetical protein [Bacilli bacterium]